MTGRAPLERLSGFGRSRYGVSHVLRPRSVEELERIFRDQVPKLRTLALRGAGRSYGDAALNDGGWVLDTSALRRILAWDPERGVVEAEPGVRIEDLWRHALPHGYWPAVVPGTMAPTLGGAVAMNVHGKNCFRVGPIGDHVEELEVILPGGGRSVCGPHENADLFRGVVAGAGLLGCIVRVRLRLDRVHAGDLRVTALPVGSLREMVERVEEHAAQADYLVGWGDALGPEAALGRGVVHRADYLAPGEHPHPERTLRASHQDLPTRVAGLIPRRWGRLAFRALASRPGMRWVNAAKYRGHVLEGERCRLEPLARYAFLLDYLVPDWVDGYGPSGMIQIQPFVPRDGAEALEEILRLARRRALPPFLVVFKKHRPDRFLLSHGLDGYSLAMDFPARRRAELWALAREIHDLTVSVGGRFYFAKDSALDAESAHRSLPEENLRAFAELKRRCDPSGVLQSELARRLFPEWLGG